MELVQKSTPSKSRFAQGTGATYDVFEGEVKLGSVHSARLSVRARQGARVRSGGTYTAWAAQRAKRAVEEGDWQAGRTSWHESRNKAVEAPLRSNRERERSD